MVWYSHLFKNFPQFFVTHTDKLFGIVNKAEVHILLEFSFIFVDEMDGNLDKSIIFQQCIKFLSWKQCVYESESQNAGHSVMCDSL